MYDQRVMQDKAKAFMQRDGKEMEKRLLKPGKAPWSR